MTPKLIQTRNQRRLLALDQCLRKKRNGITRKEIDCLLKHQGLGMSLSTFNRDIRLLRDRGAPIGHEYRDDDAGTKTEHWFYRNPAWTLSNIHMTDGALFSLLVAQRVMEQYSGLPVAFHLRQAFDSIAEALNRKISIQHDSLVPVSMATERADPVIPAVWVEVAKATMRHKKLQMTYRKGWGEKAGTCSTRMVEPYHIVNLHGTWYLLATASAGKLDLRQYALSRIQKAEALNESFQLPEGFDIKRFLDVTFGQFIGDPDNVTEVHVRFDKRVAPLVMSRQFSASERKTELPGGDIDLKFPASAAGPWPLYHVKSWVLSWGADVEVLGPESLRTIVRDEIEKMTNRTKKEYEHDANR